MVGEFTHVSATAGVLINLPVTSGGSIHPVSGNRRLPRVLMDFPVTSGGSIHPVSGNRRLPREESLSPRGDVIHGPVGNYRGAVLSIPGEPPVSVEELDTLVKEIKTDLLYPILPLEVGVGSISHPVITVFIQRKVEVLSLPAHHPDLLPVKLPRAGVHLVHLDRPVLHEV